jgi:NADPH:quinone reductase-like Zn-dependent oxidoreductase
MARVVRFGELGGPEVLRIEEEPDRAPGPGEVALDVQAIGLNRAETLYRQGRYLEAPVLPSGLGFEASGLVAEVGPGVDGVAVGDAVSVVPIGDTNTYPTYGDRIVVPAASLAVRDPGVSPETAAATWMAYLTAYGALFELGGLRPAEAVLITAASSSVGIAAIQLANHIGAVPIATTRSEAKRAALLGHGAASVVATDTEDLVARVRELTGGRGVRLAFDAVAGPGAETVAHAVAPGGTLFVYGNLAQQVTPVPRGLRALAVQTYTVYEITRDPDRLGRAMAFIRAGLRAGTLVPAVDRTFDLSDVVEAHRYLEASGQVGKVVLTVGR